jgi:hypothetical protein
MKRARDPRWFVIALFLGVIASVPLVQMVMEMREGNGVRALDVFTQAPTSANLRDYEHSLDSANWLGRLTRPWVQFAQFKWLGDGAEKVVIGRSGWYFYKPGLNYMLSRPEMSKAASATNDPIPAILDFRDQLAARGIKLMIVPVPNKESVYPDRVTPRAEGVRAVLSPRTEAVLAQLREAKVEVIDLFTVFGKARQAGGDSKASLYLAQDTHWSPAGVDLAAKTVASRLLELGWVQPGNLQYKERPAPVRRLGDILRMLQVPEINRSTPPEEVACTQILQSDNGQPYNDGAGAEVLVLGDSFSRVYQTDEPKSAGFIAHLAKELKQPLLSLVNDGGGSTLVRKELRARPAFMEKKKVVIWEFVERDIGIGVEGWKLVPLGPLPKPAFTAN